MTTQTSRQLAAGQVRSLRAIRSKILAMSTKWDEVDQYNLGVLEELADCCESVAVELLAEGPAKEDF